ncbi:MAG TPA: DegQ family serine endoprotease [Candidatus Competibacter sp.]|nr:serine peptidase [Candidatus Competibacteraceae bacterium]HRE55903.1 DegQ family serine endoprotease [Candidatus Competibacter sp.]HUM93157.1 DegQ family serine endoprotease [Candidatus Competibacter sp.]
MQCLKPPFWLLAAVGLLWGAAGRAADYPDFVTLVERYSPAVVSIQTKSEPKEQSKRGHPAIPENSPFHDYFKRFFDEMPDMPARPRSSVGSGFIISADGYIVTNAHVVEGMSSITVGLSDRGELTAQVVGADKRSDIALLKIKADAALPTVKIGDSGKVKVGQWVLAIGSPFGFESTASQGIVSALGRNLPSDNYVPFIQTDAAVNPGSSGGPLFNMDGEVIGVNSQIYSRSGGYQGVSFAIPVDVAMEVVEQLKSGGKVSRGWLGVMIQEVTPELAQSFGLDKPRGALVGQIMADGPAQKAELKAGDIIVAFNGQPVRHSSDLPLMVGRTRPGTDIALTLIREGKEHTLNARIEQLPDESKLQPVLGEADAAPATNPLGLAVTELPAEKRKQNSVGVLVKEVGEGPAAEAGIRAGDVIARINNVDLHDPAQFAELAKSLPVGRPIPVLVRRDNGSLFMALTLPDKK